MGARLRRGLRATGKTDSTVINRRDGKIRDSAENFKIPTYTEICLQRLVVYGLSVRYHHLGSEIYRTVWRIALLCQVLPSSIYMNTLRGVSELFRVECRKCGVQRQKSVNNDCLPCQRVTHVQILLLHLFQTMR